MCKFYLETNKNYANHMQIMLMLMNINVVDVKKWISDHSKRNKILRSGKFRIYMWNKAGQSYNWDIKVVLKNNVVFIYLFFFLLNFIYYVESDG